MCPTIPSSFSGNVNLVGEAIAICFKEQPRQAVNETSRRGSPRVELLHQQQSSLLQVLHQDCRLFIWEYILRPSQTRIERWQIPGKLSRVSAESSDTDCFPYRITAAECGISEKPLNLLLSCRQLFVYLPSIGTRKTPRGTIVTLLDYICIRETARPLHFPVMCNLRRSFERKARQHCFRANRLAPQWSLLLS
jgi:hypothetical protein